MNDSKHLSNDLVNIFAKAVENKIYGSVEIFFEEGRITQVTQRIINKITAKKDKEKTQTKNYSTSNI